MLIPCPQACYSLPTNLWWSCAGQFSGSLKEPSYETTSWCESVLSWPEVLRALGQNVKIIGGWADGDGDHHPATTWPTPKAVGKSRLLVNMYTTLSLRDLLLKHCQSYIRPKNPATNPCDLISRFDFVSGVCFCINANIFAFGVWFDRFKKLTSVDKKKAKSHQNSWEKLKKSNRRSKRMFRYKLFAFSVADTSLFQEL